MDTPTTIGIGVAVALGLFISSRMMVPAIEAVLRAQGALTLPALTEAVGLKGFSARGKVILALNDMVAQGKVRTIAAPDGTPQLQKVNFIKYELAA